MNWSRRQLLEAVVMAATTDAVNGASTPTSVAGERVETEKTKRFDFEDIDLSGSVDNDDAWNQKAGPCCQDDPFHRLFTWEEGKRASKSLPNDTLEPTDYTKDYYQNIGGNFIVQQSGGYGEFFSTFFFSDHSSRYPNAPYQPDTIKIHVGGNDHEREFNDYGYLELRDASSKNIARFEFPHGDGAGPLQFNGNTVVSDRTNGLYQVIFDNIDWDTQAYDVEMYQQTSSGYESTPVYSKTGVSFDGDASNFDSLKTYVLSSGHVYLDNLILRWTSDSPTPTPMSTTSKTPTSETPTPEPLSTKTPTSETPTPERPSTNTTTDQGATAQPSDQDGGNIPVIFGALGLGGVGAGAWWWRRNNVDDGSAPAAGGMAGETGAAVSADISGGAADSGLSGGSSTNTGSGSESSEGGDSKETAPSASGSDQTADSGLLADIKDAIDTGDESRDAASDYRDDGQYDRALKQYDKAQEAYEEALNTAEESDLIDTDEIEEKLAAVQYDRQEVHHQRLQDKEAALHSDLDHAESLAGDGDLEKAQEQLEALEPALAAAKETAAQHAFSDLYDDIVALEERREQRLEEVTDRLETHPVPDNIPCTPDVPVEYDALTDEEPIGGGGNADVTKATVPTPDGDMTLAIKRPRMAGTLHKDAVKRMLQEGETWDKLDDHDHIVGVVDYGSEPIPWIAMEYMDGGHLGEQRGAMDIPQALWTAIAVTKGVRHAHRRGVAHLDLKPENILFRTVEYAWDVPKVADWGLSKHLLEHSKSVGGMSVEYAAPEQFDNDYGQADDITDIYQLGAVFYELFTGRPPFEGQPFKVIDMVKTEQPTPPSEIADVPDGLDGVLLTALAKEKADRYDTVEYLRDALQDLFDEY